MPTDSLALIDPGTGSVIFDTLLPQWGFIIVMILMVFLNKLKWIDAIPTAAVVWVLCQVAAFAVRFLFAPELSLLLTTTAGSALAGNALFLGRFLPKKQTGG